MYRSDGAVMLNAKIRSMSDVWIPFVIAVDIVECSIPLLISRRSLVAMSAIIVNFSKNEMSIGELGVAKALISTSGHLALNLVPLRPPLIKASGSDKVFWSQVDRELDVSTMSEIPRTETEWETVMMQENQIDEQAMTPEEVKRIHLHLPHASYSATKRLLRIGKRCVSDRIIFEVLRNCTCRGIDERIQHPIVTKYIPEYPGHTIFMDVCYPVNRDRNYPCLLVTDALSRFINGRLMSGLDNDSTLSALTTGWFQWLGVPKTIVTDAGTCVTGKCGN